MIRPEEIKIDKIELLSAAARLKSEGHRLAQICVTKSDAFDFVYTFEKGGKYTNITFSQGFDCPLPSIGWLYSYAFIYENEMKDLFGVCVTDMNVDYKGHLYITSIKTPFNPAEKDVNADG